MQRRQRTKQKLEREGEENQEGLQHESQANGGPWVAQSVKCLTLDFSSAHDLGVVRSSPVSGPMLSEESA